MSEIVRLLVIFTLAIIVSVKFYRHLLIGFASVIYFPLFVQLKAVGLLVNVLARYNQRLMAKGRYTIWLKRLTRMAVVHADLSESVLNSFLLFVLGEQKMAIVIKRVGEEVTYVPLNQRDLPEAEQAVFIFKKISRKKLASERDRTVGLSAGGRVESLRTASVGYHITVQQLHGWKNITDENGNTVAFDAANKEQMYELLPVEIQEELEAEFGGGVGSKVTNDEEDSKPDTVQEPVAG